MGAAALSGFPPEVIARATQRCTSLFNEGMIMRTLVETPFNANEDFETRYAPDEIPDIPSEFVDDESNDVPTVDRSKVYKDKLFDPLQKPWTCVLKGCRRQDKGFPSQHDLVRHLKLAHKLTDEEVQEELGRDSEESEVEGGVQYVFYMFFNTLMLREISN